MPGVEVSPLAWIESQFVAQVLGEAQALKDFVPAVLAKYERLLDDASVPEVPCLSSSPGGGRLVRLWGMVQDMTGPEYFLAAARGGDGKGHSDRCLLWREPGDAHERMDESSELIGDRSLYSVVPIPGLAAWADVVAVPESGKRAAEEVPDSEPATVRAKTADGTPQPVEKEVKDWRKAALPLGGPESAVLTVKVYGDCEWVKLNSAVEWVGLLFDSVLHVLAARPLAPAAPLRRLPPVGEGVQAVRGEAKRHLTALLQGDDLAAEFLLCALHSSVYLRHETIGIGALSLNVSGLESAAASKLSASLAQLMPKTELAIPLLNGGPWVPWKDYESGRLTAGRLQLSPGTLLVLDETKMAEGRLDKVGLGNLGALKAVLSRQEVDYDFKFHTAPFHTDILVLCLSEGRSLLQMDLHVVLKPTGTWTEEVAPLTPSVLSGIRRELLERRCAEDYGLGESMEAIVEADFVAMRKVDPNFSPQDLQGLLVLARAVVLSHGERELSPGRWAAAKGMEAQRRARLAKP